MFFRNIYKKGIIILFFFLFNTLFSQQEFKEFYNSLNAKFPDIKLVKEAKQDYLKKYKKNKRSQNLAFANIIDIIFINPKDSIKNLRKAYEIINFSEPESASRAEGYYWTGVFLEKNSLDLSRSFLQKAIDINLKNKNEYLLPINYHILGRNYYRRGDYKKALSYFRKALGYFLKQGEITHSSSMYNNFGLTYAKMKKYPLAIKNAEKAIKVLKTKKLVYYENVFLHSIITNLGNYYYETGNYEKALVDYERVFKFSEENPQNKESLYSVVPKMYKLYKNNPQKLKIFLTKLRSFKDNDFNNSLNIEILKILQQNALDNGSLSEIKTITTVLNNYRDLYRLMLLKKQRQTTDDLNKYVISSIEKEQYITQQQEKYKNLIFLFIFSSSAFGIFYLFKINLLNKEKAQIKNDLLEKEKGLILERMQHLNLNLDLKSKTEQEFLFRIKKLKKEKKIDTEEIIKDLHLSISGLLNIDQRHEIEVQKKNILNENFTQKLKEDFPELSAQELQLCGYLHLSLSNKEIALLQNLTPPSVRVYKTRLKAKLGLSKDQDLEAYLKTMYS